jgi:hypothetical protein
MKKYAMENDRIQGYKIYKDIFFLEDAFKAIQTLSECQNYFPGYMAFGSNGVYADVLDASDRLSEGDLLLNSYFRTTNVTILSKSNPAVLKTYTKILPSLCLIPIGFLWQDANFVSVSERESSEFEYFGQQTKYYFNPSEYDNLFRIKTIGIYLNLRSGVGYRKDYPEFSAVSVNIPIKTMDIANEYSKNKAFFKTEEDAQNSLALALLKG